MKRIILFILFCLPIVASAQEDCQYSVNTNEGGKELKTTKEYLMYESVFGGTSNFIFFSLTISDGVPILNFQLLAKSKEFTKVYCLDKASRIYLQLNNGKIVTLINALDDQCSGLVYDNVEKNNIRVLGSSFLFTKGSLEELEKSRISFIRIKYVSETVDYPIKPEMQSETTGLKYLPERYFINNLKCIQ
jgi:hypothetical protein